MLKTCFIKFLAVDINRNVMVVVVLLCGLGKLIVEAVSPV